MSHNSALTPASMLTSLLIQNTEAGVADDKKGSNSPCYQPTSYAHAPTPSNLSSTSSGRTLRFAAPKAPGF